MMLWTAPTLRYRSAKGWLPRRRRAGNRPCRNGGGDDAHARRPRVSVRRRAGAGGVLRRHGRLDPARRPPPDRRGPVASAAPGNPETDFVTLKSEIITKDQAKDSLARLLSRSHEKEAFVFVHGFNNRYEDAVHRFAQILYDSGAGVDVAPILFTWPSAGNVFAYEYDRDSANYSRYALENLLRYPQDDPEVKTISILAHSMGNWVTLEALRQMAIRDGRVAPKVKVILLADADVDVEIAREQIATLGPDHPHIVLFV